MRVLVTSGLISLAMVIALTSCFDPTKKSEDEESSKRDTGKEYAPQMYHSIPYEPLTQITEEDKTFWGSEYMNTNPHSTRLKGYNINALEPVEGTVRYGQPLPYLLTNDSAGFAQANLLENPFDLQMDADGNLTVESKKVYDEGAELYLRFCSHCHGKTGESDGPVSEKYGGVTRYSANLKGKNAGHIFHVLTYGVKRMPSHASQLDQNERWKIATFVIKEFKK